MRKSSVQNAIEIRLRMCKKGYEHSIQCGTLRELKPAKSSRLLQIPNNFRENQPERNMYYVPTDEH